MEMDDNERRKYARRNVYGLGVAFMLAHSANYGLQGLQSSINSNDGLGLLSLSVLYGCGFIVGFITPGAIRILGTKLTLMIAFSCRLAYILCNFYPSWYTLMPGSVLAGVGFSLMWAAGNAHIAEIAKQIAPKDWKYLISKYTGILLSFHSLSYLPGNLTSSLLLFPYNYIIGFDNRTDFFSTFSADGSSSGDSLESPFIGQICGKIDNESAVVKDELFYSLLSIYAACMLTALLVLTFCLNRLPMENSFFSTASELKFQLYVKEPFIQLVRVLTHKYTLLLAPMAVANGMVFAFPFGTFAEHFVSDCFGTFLVGFVMILFGLSSSAMSMAYGKLVKVLPRFVILLFGALVNIGLITFLLIWERTPSYSFIFTFAILWGVAESVWSTVTPSLSGILFPDRTEFVYGMYTVYLSIGLSATFAIAHLLSLKAQLWIIFAVVIAATLCNLIIEFTTQTIEQIFHKEKRTSDSSETHQEPLSSDSKESISTSTSSPAGVDCKHQRCAAFCVCKTELEHGRHVQPSIVEDTSGANETTIL